MSKTRGFNGEFYQMFKELIFQGSWLTVVKGILDQTWTHSGFSTTSILSIEQASRNREKLHLRQEHDVLVNHLLSQQEVKRRNWFQSTLGREYQEAGTPMPQMGQKEGSHHQHNSK